MLPTKSRIIWPSGFRWEDFFRNQPIRNKNCLWRPCLLTNRDEMSNHYRGPVIDASYQVSDHLAKWFQKRRFLEIGQSETRIAYGPWRLCLLTDWGEMSNLNRGPSIDAFYQISVDLAKGFHRRKLNCEKLMDHRHQVMEKVHKTMWANKKTTI